MLLILNSLHNKEIATIFLIIFYNLVLTILNLCLFIRRKLSTDKIYQPSINDFNNDYVFKYF